MRITPMQLRLDGRPAELVAAIAMLMRLSRQSSLLTPPTPMDVVERMLTFAKVGPDDVVYDLGCGDGRIVISGRAEVRRARRRHRHRPALDRAGTDQRASRLASKRA